MCYSLYTEALGKYSVSTSLEYHHHSILSFNSLTRAAFLSFQPYLSDHPNDCRRLPLVFTASLAYSLAEGKDLT